MSLVDFVLRKLVGTHLSVDATRDEDASKLIVHIAGASYVDAQVEMKNRCIAFMMQWDWARSMSQGYHTDEAVQMALTAMGESLEAEEPK